MLTPLILSSLQKSKWLEDYVDDDFDIHSCKEPYEVFERILTTLAKVYDCDWQDIWNASIKNHKRYVLLCISVILIDRYLNKLFKMKIEDRAELLGKRNNQIVKFYYLS